jgi:hypothetical protein
LAAWALPKVLAGFKTASGAAVTLQWFGGAFKRALHLGVKLFMLKLFIRNPLGGSHQGWFAL